MYRLVVSGCTKPPEVQTWFVLLDRPKRNSKFNTEHPASATWGKLVVNHIISYHIISCHVRLVGYVAFCLLLIRLVYFKYDVGKAHSESAIFLTLQSVGNYVINRYWIQVFISQLKLLGLNELRSCCYNVTGQIVPVIYNSVSKEMRIKIC